MNDTMTHNVPAIEVLTAQLGAATRSAHDVCTYLRVVQTALRDFPQAVAAEDVTALYTAFRSAEALEQAIRGLQGRLRGAE